MKVKTRQEISQEFGIHRKTLYRWLKRENIELQNRLITPSEQMLIYKTFGFPKLLLKKRFDVPENHVKQAYV
jgi:hypothetical protein